MSFGKEERALVLRPAELTRGQRRRPARRMTAFALAPRPRYHAHAAHTGRIRLDDPAQKYLPTGVKLPTRDNKVITLGSPARSSSVPTLASGCSATCCPVRQGSRMHAQPIETDHHAVGARVLLDKAGARRRALRGRRPLEFSTVRLSERKPAFAPFNLGATSPTRSAHGSALRGMSYPIGAT